jgi:hypothetical protein
MSPPAPPRRRNTGAAIARGDILYFIHADCSPTRRLRRQHP